MREVRAGPDPACAGAANRDAEQAKRQANLDGHATTLLVSNRAGVENRWSVSPSLAQREMPLPASGNEVANVPTEGAAEEHAAEAGAEKH